MPVVGRALLESVDLTELVESAMASEVPVAPVIVPEVVPDETVESLTALALPVDEDEPETTCRRAQEMGGGHGVEAASQVSLIS